MIQITLIVIAVIIAAIVIYVATKPNDFQIQRTTGIKAPPDKIFPLINDLHNMQTWSAWGNRSSNATQL
jgi:hypothetical protein